MVGQYVAFIKKLEADAEKAAKEKGKEGKGGDSASWAIPKPKAQYGTVEEPAALRAKSNFGAATIASSCANVVARAFCGVGSLKRPVGWAGGTLAMPLATSMVARQLRPIVAWGNSTGLPEVIGYSWRSDAALRQPSPGPPYSFEATCAFAANIKCPVLIITALDGMYTTSFRLGMKQKWIDNMFAPQTRCVMAIMHGVASARATARPHAKVRYGLGLAASLALYFGAGLPRSVARWLPLGISHLRPAARVPAALAVGGILACVAGYLFSPVEPDQATRARLAQLEDLRNSTKKLSYYKRLTHVQLPTGGHHVHMVNPEGCAKAIEEWTAANPE